MQIGKTFGKIVLVHDDNEIIPATPSISADLPLLDLTKQNLPIGGIRGNRRFLAFRYSERSAERYILFFI